MKNSCILCFMVLVSCTSFPAERTVGKNAETEAIPVQDEFTELPESLQKDTLISPGEAINKNSAVVKKSFSIDMIAYAKTLIGTPYKYASVNPIEGFDCSGFITYVFNHFSIEVPRSSAEFTNYGVAVNRMDAESGDLILFTGTDSSAVEVGHMGIITENVNGEILFIHSTSGKANGVTITPLNSYYLKRFVKIIRIPVKAGKQQ